MTQAEIGEVIGVGEGTVKQHSVLMNKIVTQVLDACKQYQNGRVTVEVTPVTFDFTEGWFRTSGLYDLPPHLLFACKNGEKWGKPPLFSP